MYDTTVPQASAAEPTSYLEFKKQFPLLGNEKGRGEGKFTNAYNAWIADKETWEQEYTINKAEMHRDRTDVLEAQMTRLIHPNLLFDREAATATKVARNLRPTTREKLK